VNPRSSRPAGAALLRALGAAGAGDAARALADRAANAGEFERFLEAYPGEAARYPLGASRTEPIAYLDMARAGQPEPRFAQKTAGRLASSCPRCRTGRLPVHQ
jgi:hypothetical protein